MAAGLRRPARRQLNNHEGTTSRGPGPERSGRQTGRSSVVVLGLGKRQRRQRRCAPGPRASIEDRPAGTARSPCMTLRWRRADAGPQSRRSPVEGAYTAEVVIDNGAFGVHKIRFETGRLARLAAGSAVVYLDDETMVLSATTASKKPKDNLDFFPLTVDVEERMYAAGRIPGSFFRREGRPSEDAILTCRLIDRPLRPSFVHGLRNEVQVVETIMALDPEHLYDVIAINAASLSTQLAGLPFSGPIGGVRVALIKGQWVAFPTHPQLDDATFDMVVAGRVLDDGDVAIMMVEAESTASTLRLIADPASGAVRPTEETVAEGLEAAKPFIKALCEAQQAIAAHAGKETAEFPVFADYGEDVFDAVAAQVSDELAAALTIAGKQDRDAETDRVKAVAKEKLASQFEDRENE